MLFPKLSRQSEGIATARAKGVQFGRRRKDLPEKFGLYYQLWAQGEISVRKAKLNRNLLQKVENVKRFRSLFIFP